MNRSSFESPEAGLNPVLILGGGVAGVSALHVLSGARVPTLLLEKARGLGGRLSTRRIEVLLPTGAEVLHVDLGAPSFSGCDPEFLAICRGLSGLREVGGEPYGSRFLSASTTTNGLSVLTKGLLGDAMRLKDFGVRFKSRVLEIRQDGAGYRTMWEEMPSEGLGIESTRIVRRESFSAVIVTAPFQQAREAMAGAFLEERWGAESLRSRLDYGSSLGVYFLLRVPGASRFQGSSGFEEYFFDSEEPFARAVLRQVSGDEREEDLVLVSLYGSDFWSQGVGRQMEDSVYGEALAFLIRQNLISADGVVLMQHRHFWRYSEVRTNGMRAPLLIAPRLWWAGSTESGDRGVESAFLAGRSAARQLLDELQRKPSEAFGSE